MSAGAGRTGRSTRRSTARGAPALVTIFWRDIPAQVTATRDGATERALLPARFQHAIDRAATVAGKTETHAYVAEWRRQTRAFEGDPHAAAAAEVARLVEDYPKRRLDDLVRRGGLAEPGAAGTGADSGGAA